MVSPQHYTLYWENEWLGRLPSGTVDHLASDQLRRRKVEVGDVIWVVTVDQGRLYLLGRLIVGEFIVGQEAAKKRLGTSDVWDAKYHVVAAKSGRVRYKVVDITDIAAELRFESKAADRLTIVDEIVLWQQLQTMRTLTQETARRLQIVWSERTQ